jgi:hypothetical protein
VRGAAGAVVPLRRVGAAAPKWETVYVLGDGWVWAWMTAGFWEGVERWGLAAAAVPKGLAARVRNHDWVDEEGAGDDGWESGCSSRGRGADREGVVRPGQPWVDSEPEEEEEEAAAEEMAYLVA